jgi:hypothetical protein
MAEMDGPPKMINRVAEQVVDSGVGIIPLIIQGLGQVRATHIHGALPKRLRTRETEEVVLAVMTTG